MLRDRRTLFILFGMPVTQILIFGFALTNEVKNSRIAILDNSKDEATKTIIHQLEASRYFDIVEYLHSYAELEPTFQEGKIRLAVVFPEQFQASLLHTNAAPIQLIADATDPNVANTLTNYASAIIMDYQSAMKETQDFPYTITTELRMLYNPQLKGSYNFVPGVMAMVLMLVGAMMTSISIVREKELGTMEVILASPIVPINVIIAKMVPYLLLSMVNIASILLLSVFVLDVPINGSLSLLVFECFLFTLTALALGLLISSFLYVADELHYNRLKHNWFFGNSGVAANRPDQRRLSGLLGLSKGRRGLFPAGSKPSGLTHKIRLSQNPPTVCVEGV